MIIFDNFPRLKRRVEELSQNAAETKGAIKQMDRRLKEEYRCSVETAEEACLKLKRIKNKLLDEYLAVKKEFESAWSQQLGEVK